MSTHDPAVVRVWFETREDGHRDRARSALEMAAQRIAAALNDLYAKGPTGATVAEVRHAAQYAAEGYAEVQAYVALHEFGFLAATPEPAPKEG